MEAFQNVTTKNSILTKILSFFFRRIDKDQGDAVREGREGGAVSAETQGNLLGPKT